MKLTKTILSILAAAAAVGWGYEAHAIAITGTLAIKGDVTLDSSFGTATTVVQFSNVTSSLNASSGVFLTIPDNSTVMMTSPYIFDPSTSTPGLWSVGGFTFDLQTSTVDMHTNSFLSISGRGTIFGPDGYDPTPGTWLFSTQNGHGSTFTFSASTTAVPDGGMTIALMGAGLVGIAIFRAKFARS